MIPIHYGIKRIYDPVYKKYNYEYLYDLKGKEALLKVDENGLFDMRHMISQIPSWSTTFFLRHITPYLISIEKDVNDPESDIYITEIKLNVLMNLVNTHSSFFVETRDLRTVPAILAFRFDLCYMWSHDNIMEFSNQKLNENFFPYFHYFQDETIYDTAIIAHPRSYLHPINYIKRDDNKYLDCLVDAVVKEEESCIIYDMLIYEDEDQVMQLFELLINFLSKGEYEAFNNRIKFWESEDEYLEVKSGTRRTLEGR